MKVSFFFICTFVFLFSLKSTAQIVTTISGTGLLLYGGDGGAATAATLGGPFGITTDAVGNIYFADGGSSRIRKIAPSGVITTVAGSGIGGLGGFGGDGGPATNALLNGPTDVLLDHSGNIIFSDFNNLRIRKVDTNGIISTICGNGSFGCTGDGGPATNATLQSPGGIAMDVAGNLYLTDYWNSKVRKVNTAGIISTIAGTGLSGSTGDGGPATDALLYNPNSVATDLAGNIYIADFFNGRVRKIDLSGIITTVAGTGIGISSGDGGPATDACINNPTHLKVDAAGNIYVTESSSEKIRKINTLGIISTLAGTGVSGFAGDECGLTPVKFHSLTGLTIDGSGNCIVSDYNNSRIRKISKNYSPKILSGQRQNLTKCSGSVINLNSYLAVNDSNLHQGETWSLVMSPLHGTATGSFSSVSGTGTIVPTGLSYTAAAGYVGADSFKISVMDCVHAADTAVFLINIVNCTLGQPSIDNEQGDNLLQIVPNPSTGIFTINLTSGLNEPVHIVVTDVAGGVIKELNTFTNITTALQLNVAAGVYMLNATTEHGQYVRKVVVQ